VPEHRTRSPFSERTMRLARRTTNPQRECPNQIGCSYDYVRANRDRLSVVHATGAAEDDTPVAVGEMRSNQFLNVTCVNLTRVILPNRIGDQQPRSCRLSGTKSTAYVDRRFLVHLFYARDRSQSKTIYSRRGGMGSLGLTLKLDERRFF
jgi:hypothetical protein